MTELADRLSGLLGDRFGTSTAVRERWFRVAQLAPVSLFLGTLVRLLVEVAPGLVLTAESSAEDAPFAEHEDVELAWARDASIVLTHE